jgi:hypothetical protein
VFLERFGPRSLSQKSGLRFSGGDKVVESFVDLPPRNIFGPSSKSRSWGVGLLSRDKMASLSLQVALAIARPYN